MDRQEKLSLNIENLRRKMHESIEKEQHTISSESLIINQKLDKLIVEYYKNHNKGDSQ